MGLSPEIKIGRVHNDITTSQNVNRAYSNRKLVSRFLPYLLKNKGTPAHDQLYPQTLVHFMMG